jgi:magnesium-transporting ATPase (P-type)
MGFLYDKLRTTPETGIKAATIPERIKAFGTNAPPQVEIESCFSKFLDALNDFTLIILMISAIFSIVVNTIVQVEFRHIAWIDGFAILCAVMISASVSSINDYQKDKQFRELNEISANSKNITVTRDGLPVSVKLSEVVVGDVVIINSGDEIAGDGLIISCSSVLADEASMTGESDALHKESQADCMNVRNKYITEGKQLSLIHI